MVPNPARFTVFNFRALETLEHHGELHKGINADDYMRYLRLYCALAARVGVDLRTLDQALWQWSTECGEATGC